MQFKFRPNTWDEGVWGSVAQANEYKINHLDLSNKLICDIGAHIGSFSYLCTTLGSTNILAFEPMTDNFNLAVHNLYEVAKAQNKVTLVYSAVSNKTKQVKMHCDTSNTGACKVYENGTIITTAIGIDEVIDMCKGEIYILKCDCEGEERLIIPACTKWNKVKYLIGEYHCMDQPDVKAMLKPYFDTVMTMDLVKSIGLFWCWRNDSEPPLTEEFLKTLEGQ